MAKERGFAVVSGSGSTAIVAKIMENGRIDFGSSVKAVEMHITGTLVLDQLSSSSGLSTGGASKVLLVGTNGTASIAQLSASNIALDAGLPDFGGATTVSGALDYLKVSLGAGSVTSVTATEGITSSGGTTPQLSLSGAAAFSNNTVLKWDDTNLKFVNSNITDNGTTVTVGSALTVTGDLTVQGTTTTIDTVTLTVEDAIVLLGSGSSGNTAGDRGLIFSLSDGNQAFGWDENASKFKLGNTVENASNSSLNITASGVLELGTLSGSNISGTNVVASNLTVNGTLNLPDNSVTNDDLVNDSITVTAGNGLLGGGLVALGGTITLSASYGSTANTAVQGDTQVTFSGVAEEIQIVNGSPLVLGSGGTVTIGLPDVIKLGAVTVTSSLVVTGSTTLGRGTGTDTTTVIGNFRIPVFTVSGANAVPNYPQLPHDDYVTNVSTYGGYSFYLTSSGAPVDGIVPGTGSFAQGNKWYFNENGEWFASFFYSV